MRDAFAVATNVVLACSSLSVFATINTLLAIYLLNKAGHKLNAYLMAVTAMTFFTGLFNLTLWMRFECDLSNTACVFARGVATNTSSLCAMGYSNVLILTAAYIVCVRKFIDLNRYFVRLSVLIIVPSLLLAVVDAYLTVYDTDEEGGTSLRVIDYLRLLLIALNTISLMFVFKEVFGMNVEQRKKSPTYQLVKRLCLYPIAQSISLIPNVAYNTLAGHGVGFYPRNNDAPKSLQDCLIAYACLVPSAGVTDALIFFLVQHESVVVLKKWWGEVLASVCCLNTKEKEKEKEKEDGRDESGEKNPSSISASAKEQATATLEVAEEEGWVKDYDNHGNSVRLSMADLAPDLEAEAAAAITESKGGDDDTTAPATLSIKALRQMKNIKLSHMDEDDIIREVIRREETRVRLLQTRCHSLATETNESSSFSFTFPSNRFSMEFRGENSNSQRKGNDIETTSVVLSPIHKL